MHRAYLPQLAGLACALSIVLSGCDARGPEPVPAARLQQVLDLASRGQLEQAEADVDDAIAEHPGAVDLHLLRGAILERAGRLDDARAAYLEAQGIAPEHPNPPLHLERITKLAALDAAIAVEREKVGEATDPAASHLALGDLLAERFLAKPARRHYTLALLHDPENAEAHAGMALVLIGMRREVMGLYHASEALRLAPDSARALGEIVWVLATSREETLRDPEEAIRLALNSRDKSSRLLDGLAAAYAQVGRHDQAVATADLAMAAATAERNHQRAVAIQARRAEYAAGRSFIGPPVDPT
jgi:tetratricopeptide (TPR) repeat protein